MGMCFVPNCKHYSLRDRCSFFRFPRNEVVRKAWIIKVRRADRFPGTTSRICSCHFKDGKKENGPSIFSWNTNEITLNESSKKIKDSKKSRVIEGESDKTSLTKENDASSVFKSVSKYFQKDTSPDRNMDAEIHHLPAISIPLSRKSPDSCHSTGEEYNNPWKRKRHSPETPSIVNHQIISSELDISSDSDSIQEITCCPDIISDSNASDQDGDESDSSDEAFSLCVSKLLSSVPNSLEKQRTKIKIIEMIMKLKYPEK